MADDLQAGICSGNWWSTPRNNFAGSSPMSSGLSEIGNFGWLPSENSEMKARSCDEQESNHSVTNSGSTLLFLESQKGQPSDSGNVFMDCSLQMTGFGLSSPDWTQALLRSSGTSESSFQAALQDDLSSRSNFRQDPAMEFAQFQKDWSPKPFSSAEDSSINSLKQINQVLALEQRLSSGNISGDCTVTGRSTPINNNNNYSTGSGSYGSPSTLLPGLFDQEPQPQQSFYGNRLLNFPSVNYRVNLPTTMAEELSPFSKFPQFIKSQQPKQQPATHLQFSNSAPFWTASATANDMRSSLFAASQPHFLAQTFEEKSNLSNLAAKTNTEEVRDSSSELKKSSSEQAFKRPRLETPSPLPTFKVRKEKLGDRITALQQLVSPFGKTDTASVLWEAIEYIKFLHEQVSVLSNPYMKNGAPIQHQQNSDKSKEGEGPKQDLRSRGLCLVPISSTFPVTTETTADFWTPTFGGTYR